MTDLSLAAELGKNLLDKNNELQNYIFNLQQIIAEKNDELNVNISIFKRGFYKS